jgi:hypothetical protein
MNEKKKKKDELGRTEITRRCCRYRPSDVWGLDFQKNKLQVYPPLPPPARKAED